jgi:amino acid adenylation domain-containing protein
LLQRLGALPDVQIGVCCERSPEAIIALLGVMKSGAAYVPLDPSYPKDRLAFMIKDSGARIIIAQRSTAEKLRGFGGSLLLWEDTESERAAFPACQPRTSAGPNNLAYMIYTSGSTGNPKGVLIEHRSLVSNIRATSAIWAVPVGTRMLQFLRFTFDASLLEIFSAFNTGGTLVMAPHEVLFSSRDLADLVRDHKVEWAILTPAVLPLLDETDFETLRDITVGGEACSEAIVNKWAPGRRFFNAYGPTETAIISSIALCHEGEGRPSIGAPLPNTSHWILDAHGQPVPVGIPGELHIGGVGVARGYHSRPELTAERFIRDPFSSDLDARMYRTGDLVKWRPDGTLDILDRIDLQVKLRGFRIELGEIEAQLCKHPDIANAAVILREDSPGDKKLVAWISLQKKNPPADMDKILRANLGCFLPDYTIPSIFVFLERLPLTPSGKVDRKALACTPIQRSQLNLRPSAANNRTQTGIAAIWRELLDLPVAPLDVPFFEAGGDSLKLARLQVAVHDRLQANVDMITLMKFATVRSLARHLDTRASALAA